MRASLVATVLVAALLGVASAWILQAIVPGAGSGQALRIGPVRTVGEAPSPDGLYVARVLAFDVLASGAEAPQPHRACEIEHRASGKVLRWEQAVAAGSGTVAPPRWLTAGRVACFSGGGGEIALEIDLRR